MISQLQAMYDQGKIDRTIGDWQVCLIGQAQWLTVRLPASA